MGRFHPVLFVLGILVAIFSLIRIGMVYGRNPRTEQIAEQPSPTVAATEPQQQPKTYRVTDEATKTVTEGNRTVTVTVRRIVEVSVAMLICVSAGSMFLNNRENYAGYPRTVPSTSSGPEADIPQENGGDEKQNTERESAREREEQDSARERAGRELDSARQSAKEQTAQVLGTGREYRKSRKEHKDGGFLGGKKTPNPDDSGQKFPQTDPERERLTGDPDAPVWVVPNSNEYVCFGGDWKRYSRIDQGKWMKQSEAIQQHKKPSLVPCE